jgi:hypothetical protein
VLAARSFCSEGQFHLARDAIFAEHKFRLGIQRAAKGLFNRFSAIAAMAGVSRRHRDTAFAPYQSEQLRMSIRRQGPADVEPTVLVLKPAAAQNEKDPSATNTTLSWPSSTTGLCISSPRVSLSPVRARPDTLFGT